jgi:hypothetical protein
MAGGWSNKQCFNFLIRIFIGGLNLEKNAATQETMAGNAEAKIIAALSPSF